MKLALEYLYSIVQKFEMFHVKHLVGRTSFIWNIKQAEKQVKTDCAEQFFEKIWVKTVIKKIKKYNWEEKFGWILVFFCKVWYDSWKAVYKPLFLWRSSEIYSFVINCCAINVFYAVFWSIIDRNCGTAGLLSVGRGCFERAHVLATFRYERRKTHRQRVTVFEERKPRG